MSQMTHPYFGTLNTDALQDTDVVWEGQVPLHNTDVEVWLWAAPKQALEASQLDAYAATLGQLAQVDQQARAALQTYLQTEPDFLDFHVEAAQQEGASAMQASKALLTQSQAAGQDSVSAADFVAALQLQSVGLWASGEEQPLVLDYQIDPEGSDQILAVKCDANGRIQEISWES